MKIKLNIVPDVPNANGHIYPKEVIEKAILEFNKRNVKVGMLKYNHGTNVDLEEVAFNIEDIDLSGAEIDILDTDAGRKLEEIISDDFRLCHTGIGDVDETGKIKEGFEIAYYVIKKKDECA
jgi:hypothetical protein